MTTRIHITEHAQMLTVRINGTAMGTSISATLSGPILYALVDGLLWWCVNRKLDALVACAQRQPAPADRNAAIFFGQALKDGEEMVMHCFTTPFHEHNQMRQLRIMEYLTKHLPGLEPLASHGPHATVARAELAELMELCTLLRERIAHQGDAKLGLEGIITTELLAA